MRSSLILTKIILCTLACPFIGLSQTKKTQDTYTDYFQLPRESLFIHTNKTVYITGEEAWYTVYVHDRKSHLPSAKTTNIYLGLYDQKGQHLTKNLILSKNGVATGNIMIDSTLTSGDYYLKVDTHWMKNFKESDAFIQKIEVLNPSDKEEEIPQYSHEYDVQFLPEGGHMIYDAKNSIGFKVIDASGKEMKCSGTIVDSKGIPTISFKSNFLGIGKFTFRPISGENYTAKITLNNGMELEKNLDGIRNNGIIISVNTIDQEEILINLATNPSTFSNIKNKAFKLLVHKDGHLKSIPIVFDKQEKLISISKENLNKGINIITLFDNQERPVLERIFFNDIEMTKPTLSIRELQRNNDSITYELVTNMMLEDDMMSMSMSILPSESISYHPKHTIQSALLLKPYLKGTIERPDYYFTNSDRKKKFELDVLLITQGWSRYSWENIFHFPPVKYFNFENGIEIKGTVNQNVSDTESLLMYPSEYHESFFIDIDEKGKFELLNFYPQRGDTLSFSSYSKKGKTKKPRLALSFVKKLAEDQITVKETKKTTRSFVSNNINLKNFITKERELLDEIVIDAKLLDRKKRRKYLLPFRGRIKEITKEEVAKYNTLADFLNFNGFQVVRNFDGTYTVLSLKSQRDPVIFFLDNSLYRDKDALLRQSIYAFEDVYIDQNSRANNFGISQEGFGFRNVIKLFSRRNSLYLTDRSEDFQQFIKVDYGFEPVKEYYAPKYVSYNIQPFKDYGVIDWKPEIIVENNKPVIFSTMNTNLEEVSFHIEGMSASGALISTTVKTSQRKNND